MENGSKTSFVANSLNFTANNFEGIDISDYGVNKAKLKMAHNFLGGFEKIEAVVNPQKMFTIRCYNNKGQFVIISPVGYK